MLKGLKCFSLLLAGALLAALLATPARADKRVALVVGNANYAGVTPLKNPLNDAPDIAKALKEIGFDVILKLDAKKPDFERALAEFTRRAADADVALFYYAGHGVQRRDKNYLLATDIEVRDQADLTALAIKFDAVRDALDESRAVKILILDACRDNPFEKQLATRSVSGGGAARGLGRIDRAEGMLIAYAAAPNQVAMDGGGRNSPFAESLIRRLHEPGVEIEAMFKRVRNDVYEKTEGGQWPEVSSMVRGDFYLTPQENDRAAWDRVRESQDAADFKKFIEKFPASPFARDAQFRLDLFERIRRDNDQQKALEARRAAEKETAEAEKREAARQESARLEAQRRDAERREEERRVAARIEAERKEAERLDAEKREAARVAAAKAEAARVEAERIEAQKREAAQAAVAAADAKRKEAERLAVERDEARRQQTAKLESEKLEAHRLAADKAEAARLDAERKQAEQRTAEERKRQAAAEEDARRRKELELKQQQVADLCAREKAELATLAGAGKPEAIDAFRKRAACPTLSAAIDAEFERARHVFASLCDKETRDFSALKGLDPAAARAAAEHLSCDSARAQAMTRVAALEEDAQRARDVCAADEAAFKAIDGGGFDAQKQLSNLRERLKCGELRNGIDAAIAKFEQRARDAQTELKRVGCYGGAVTGRLDEATRASMKTYAGRKNEDIARLRLDDDFLSQLKNQNLNVCPPATLPVAHAPAEQNNEEIVKRARPAPARHQHAAREEEEERPKPARRTHRVEREPEPEAKPARQRPHVAAPRTRPEPVVAVTTHVRQAPEPRPAVEAPAAPRAAVIHGVGF